MENPVLQIPVSGPHRTLEPGRHKNAQRRYPLRVHIKEPEDLWFGITKRMNHRARLEVRLCRQVHDELHSYSPIASMMLRRSPEMTVQLLADRPDRSVSDNSQRRPDFHARSKAIAGLALL